MEYRQSLQSQLDDIRNMMTIVSTKIQEINDRKTLLCIDYQKLCTEKERIQEIMKNQRDPKSRR